MINYDILNKQEQNTKIFRDLYTVFVSSGNKGLTDTEIYNEIIRLKISGYNSKNPECIIRGNISRWNTSSIKHQTGGQYCDKCEKRYACYGYEFPERCKLHRENEMKLLTTKRILCRKDDKKTKYFFNFDIHHHIEHHQIDVLFSSDKFDASYIADIFSRSFC